MPLLTLYFRTERSRWFRESAAALSNNKDLHETGNVDGLFRGANLINANVAVLNRTILVF